MGLFTSKTESKDPAVRSKALQKDNEKLIKAQAKVKASKQLAKAREDKGR